MQIYKTEESQEYYFKEGCHILELLNSSEDPEVSIARARVEPGVTTKCHRLHGITERYVILNGEGRVEIEGKNETVSPGSVVVIPQGAAQCITNIGNSELTFLAVCSPRFMLESYEEI